MKLLLDFLPIILFFGTFKYAEGHADWAARFATDHLGAIVSGGVVGTDTAPVLLATVVVIVATTVQIAWLLARRRKIDLMLW
ncbi:MAG TPA: septation protein IspZ, partial [Burkholderiaceae bacterium]